MRKARESGDAAERSSRSSRLKSPVTPVTRATKAARATPAHSPRAKPRGAVVAKPRPAASGSPELRRGAHSAQKKAPAARPAARSQARRITPVTPAASRSAPALTAEDLLQKAMAAETPRARALWARRGLSSSRRLDPTTQSMLLRQLYLAYYETRRFDKALEISRQNLDLEVLTDVIHQDAARAAQALGDVDAAAGHLRLAARVGPAKRRAFHWWTLGSVYFLAGRHEDAISALTRAARWGTTDKPLYQGHLAIVRCAGGEQVPDLPALMDRLAAVPAGQGYGRFVLGHLAYHERRWDEARRYLQAFVKRSEGGRVAVAIALGGEIALARQTLSRLEKES